MSYFLPSYFFALLWKHSHLEWLPLRKFLKSQNWSSLSGTLSVRTLVHWTGVTTNTSHPMKTALNLLTVDPGTSLWILFLNFSLLVLSALLFICQAWPLQHQNLSCFFLFYGLWNFVVVLTNQWRGISLVSHSLKTYRTGDGHWSAKHVALRWMVSWDLLVGVHFVIYVYVCLSFVERNRK